MDADSLFEPMLERDLDAIPAALERAARDAGPEAALGFVIRFAAIAYTPSLHGKHAFLASAALADLAESLPPERFLDLIAACAVYASRARQPWSEPPLRTVVEEIPPEASALESILASADARRGEEWLSGAAHDATAGEVLLRIAAKRPGESGHNLIVAAAAIRLVRRYPPAARYELLRPAVVELFAYPDVVKTAAAGGVDRHEALSRAVAALRAERGSPESFHRVVLLDALLEAGPSLDEPTANALLQRIAAAIPPHAPELPRQQTSSNDIESYELARDCGALLKSHAISRRLQARFPELITGDIVRACRDNLLHGESFSDWGFS